MFTCEKCTKLWAIGCSLYQEAERAKKNFERVKKANTRLFETKAQYLKKYKRFRTIRDNKISEIKRCMDERIFWQYEHRLPYFIKDINDRFFHKKKMN
ncbi:hypothetical protein ACFLRN_05460 [Thermoproteota archaeon]